MTLQEIVVRVSEETNIPKEIVDKVYRGYWQSIKSMIQELPLKEDLSEVEFNELKTNFNIPSLGKLNCTFNRMLNIKKRFNWIKEIKENAKAKEN